MIHNTSKIMLIINRVKFKILRLNKLGFIFIIVYYLIESAFTYCYGFPIYCASSLGSTGVCADCVHMCYTKPNMLVKSNVLVGLII